MAHGMNGVVCPTLRSKNRLELPRITQHNNVHAHQPSKLVGYDDDEVISSERWATLYHNPICPLKLSVYRLDIQE